MENPMPIFNPSNGEMHQFLRGKVSQLPSLPLLQSEADAVEREARLRAILKPHVLPEEEEEEVLVPADETSEPLPTIGNTADVAYQIRQVNQLLQDAAEFRSQAAEAQAFYDKRIEALETRATMLKENCGRYLKLNGMQRLVTHSGTIFFSKRTKVTLPEEEVLLEWAIDEDPSNQMGLYKTVVNKGDLKKYVESSGHKPEGYLEEKVEGISIRKVA